MKYRVCVWCDDCTDSDPLGCGDGNPWHVYDDDFNIKEFDSKEAAEEAGWSEVRNVAPWRFEVEEIA